MMRGPAQTLPDMTLPTAWHHRVDRLTLAKALALLALMFVCVQLVPTSGPVIEMQLYSPEPGLAQWFLDSGDGYSEDESVIVPMAAGDNRLRFPLPSGSFARLRFDPVKASTPVTIRSIAVTPIAQVVSGELQLDGFVPGNHVEMLERTGGGMRVVPEAGTADPQLVMQLAQPLVVRGAPRHWAEDLLAALLLTGLAWLLIGLFGRLRVDQLVVLGLGCAFVLLLVMGAVHQTSVPVHPDERLHLSGFNYYLAHFWPPAADSPDIVESLRSSPWGVSYLNSYDVVYFLAAHVMAPFSGVLESPLVRARAFQNLLWLVLLVLALRRRSWATGLAVLLITPQVWYVFSYFNGDAFALFLCMVAAMLAGDRRGGLWKFVRDGGSITAASVVFSFCIGLALVSKANYLPAVMGVLLWLAVCHLQARWLEIVAALLMAGLAGTAASIGRWGGPDLSGAVPWLTGMAVVAGIVGLASLLWRYRTQLAIRPVVHRVVVLLAVALVVATPRIVNDRVINGGSQAKAEAVTAMKEQYARRDFKPSVIAAGDGYAGLHPARHGMELSQMLLGERQWLRTSARSAFGTYGYMDIWAPAAVYRAMWLLVLLLAGAVAVALLRSPGIPGGKMLLVVSGTCSAVLGSSILFSWIYNFQPQGRYLLPMLPMLALALLAARPLHHRWLFKLTVAALAALSVWSYVYVAIPEIAARAG